MNDKKYLRNILLAVVLLIAIALFLFWTLRNQDDRVSALVPASDGEAKKVEQVYLSRSYPVLNSDDKIFGSSKTPLKIFVYEDNANLYSAELATTLDKIYFENKDKIAIIVRPFLTPREEAGRKAAALVECAGEQGKWKEMRALLFVRTQEGQLDFDDNSQMVAQLDLNEKEFATCLTSESKYVKIEKLSTEAEQYGVSGTPTIFIGEEMILGARPYDDYVDSNGDEVEGLNSLVQKRLGD